MPLLQNNHATVPAPLNETVNQIPLIYFDHGYEAGYKQAITDLLAELVPWSERFIDNQSGRGDELRMLVYRFEDFLEGRISRMKPDGQYVEDGLGI